MKRAWAAKISLAGLFLVLTLASAQAATPTTTNVLPPIPKIINAEKQASFAAILQEKRAAALEKFQAARETFKENLAKIKDAKKKALVEKIDSQMANINKNRTDAMSKHLEKMNEILNRIIEKTATLKDNGKDVSAVETAIAAAQKAIGSAETAVANQAGKEYVANITYESTLKNTVGAAIKQLTADLKTTHQTVTDAKKAVADAAKALAKVVSQLPTASPTAEPSNNED